MSGVLNLLLAGAASAIKDAYFNLTTLLLNTSSTNGAQNNTFLDSSTNNFTITRNGNTTQGTFTPFSQTGWSNYFNGSSAVVTVANSNLAIGTGNATFECWFNTTVSSEINSLCGTTNEAAWNANSYSFVYGGSTGISMYNGSGGTLWSIATGNIHDGVWHHIAIVRSSGVWQVFVDGVSKGTTTTQGTRDMGGNTWRFAVGGVDPSNTTGWCTGYISNFRLNNTAVYTANFTPSTTPLSAITGTLLLTSQSNRFIDNSTSAIAFTTGGTPSVQAFSPFAPTAAYSTSAVGGSGYFDGSGDYLTLGGVSGLALSTGDFEISMWVYWNSVGTQVLYEGRPGSNGAYPVILTNSSVLYYFVNSANAITGPTVVANQWYYITVSRVSGTTKMFVNGSQVGSSWTDSTNYGTGGTAPWIGAGYAPGDYMNGYISNVRVVIGSGVTSQTVPTAPLTAITNTKLLLSCTNTGIYDSAAKNDLETVGNAQVSTTQAKWGTTSMYFDGTGDYLPIPSGYNLGFGTGDFTIEGWLYLNATSSYSTIISNRPNGSDTTTGRWSVAVRSSAFEFYANGSQIISAGTVSTSTWTHFAVTRASGSLRLFLGGTQVGSTTSFTTDLSSLATWVGANGAGTEAINAYIDDLRVTKGYARYTANFTPPTEAFPLQQVIHVF